MTPSPELLDADRIARYARQLLVPGFGAAGQERLLASRVQVVGADGTATAALLTLAEAGVGTIWIDDPDVVAPADLGGWLYPAEAVGRPRAEAAAAALAARSRFVSARPHPVGGVPTATLVCARAASQAIACAEVARRAGVPHVAMEVDGEGGALVEVPVGAPCYACGRAALGGRPPAPAAAALAVLAAQLLLQLIAEPGATGGRRVDLVRGVASARPTTRLPGCACGLDRAAGAGRT